MKNLGSRDILEHVFFKNQEALDTLMVLVNHSPGTDGIDARLLCEAKGAIDRVQADFQTITATAEVPDNWRTANMAPFLFK